MMTPNRLDQAFRDQPSLFDAVPGVSPSIPMSIDRGVESRNATYDAIVEEMPAKRRWVYSKIVEAGLRGLTLDELCAVAMVPANAVSGRVTELVASGHVARTSDRRITRSGQSASVLVARILLADTSSAVQPVANQKPQELSMSYDMPDQLTRTDTPRDQFDQRLSAGLQYLVGGLRHMCFEDEFGELWIQRCHPLGTLVPNSPVQSVLQLQPGRLGIERLAP